MSKILTALFITFLTITVYGQCTNTFYFPPSEISASIYNDTILISQYNYAGDYAIVRGLTQGETYQISSSAASDYITIREANDATNLIIHGPSPLSITADLIDRISVHINISSSDCSSENTNRITNILCTTCDTPPPAIGINSSDPRATLEVNGELLLGDSQRPPLPGMLRWNAAEGDFEGYNGDNWVSLTKANSSSWGTVSNPTVNENDKIFATGNDIGIEFGKSVAFDGDYAVVGAPQFDEFLQPEGIGDAYIFKQENGIWQQIQKVSASDGAPNDLFGTAVDISGDYMAIGARSADVNGNSNQGAVYIFQRSLDNWNEVAKLIATDGQSSDWFGHAVSLESNTLVVGAPQADIGFLSNRGAAYVFDRTGSNWTETEKLDGLASSSGNFGQALDLHGNYIVVGAPNASVGAIANQGEVMVFNLSSGVWSLQTTISDDDGAAFDNFGASVGIHMPHIVIGATNKESGPNTNQGGAYVYQNVGSNWNLRSYLSASDGMAYDFFGNDVDIHGTEIVIGSYQSDVMGNNLQGAAYLYELIGITSHLEKSKILASDGNSSNRFGFAVCMNAHLIMIGAISASGVNNSLGKGAVYLLSKN